MGGGGLVALGFLFVDLVCIWCVFWDFRGFVFDIVLICFFVRWVLSGLIRCLFWMVISCCLLL